ncbi:MAG: NAD(P)/FAD-dependent oxidoreductase [Gemmatimonadaceae bacterium]
MSVDLSANVPAWNGRGPLSLAPLAGDVAADICVVGLGGSGLTCIQELLRLGQDVVGIDAQTVGGGAAGRNGGFLLAGTATFYHQAVAELGRERARRIYQLTLDEIDRIAADAPEVVLRSGSLRIASCAQEEADCTLQLEAMQADGFQVSRYHGAEGRGLVFPADGSFNPLARCHLLAKRITSGGARLYEQSRAISCTPGEVRTQDGRVRCARVIVAVDGHLEVILPELSGRVRTARLQMLGTGPAPELSIPRPIYTRWGYDYWQQLPDRRVVIGGCRDRFVAAEWTSDNWPTAQVQSCLEQLLRETVGVQQPISHRWAAAVGYSSGVLPIMDEIRPDVWAIGGYSGTGNVLGALYGRMVAHVAVTGQSPVEFAVPLH